jgi:hypothetical protein
MFNYFGMGGSIVLLIAWLFIAVTMTFDIEIQDMFRWVPPHWRGYAGSLPGGSRN